MRNSGRLIVLIVASMFLLGAAAPQYVQAPSLNKVVNTPIGNVSGGTINVPLITWGGDIATVFANGNSRTTVKGSIFNQKGLSVKLFREDDFKKQVEMYLRGDT
ncbi:MAG: ABC-type nitrate/sulfonate/bicarbonate transport system, periplasmic component, partial [Candidatus Azambacteria bacterium GW2011_GWA2_42_9]